MRSSRSTGTLGAPSASVATTWSVYLPEWRCFRDSVAMSVPAHVEDLGRGARAVDRRRTELEANTRLRSARIREAVEIRARGRRVARGDGAHVARRERVGEEIPRAGGAGGEEDERRAERATLA